MGTCILRSTNPEGVRVCRRSSCVCCAFFFRDCTNIVLFNVFGESFCFTRKCFVKISSKIAPSWRPNYSSFRGHSGLASSLEHPKTPHDRERPMRRSHRGRSSVSATADGTQDELEWRRPRSKSHDRDSGYKGVPVPLSRPTLLMDALWSGAILGLSLPLGPVLAIGWSETSGKSGALPGVRLGIWAASLYAGKLGALAAPRLLPPLQALLSRCRSAGSSSSSSRSPGRRGLPPPTSVSKAPSSTEMWWWSFLIRHASLLAGALVLMLLAFAVGPATSFVSATAARFALGAAHGSFSAMAGSGSAGAGNSSGSSSVNSSNGDINGSSAGAGADSSNSSSSNGGNSHSGVLSAATGARAFTFGLALGLGSVGLISSRSSSREDAPTRDDSGHWPSCQAPCLVLAVALAVHALWACVLSPATAPGAQALHTALQALCWRLEERGFTCFGLNRGNSRRGAYAAVSSSGDGDSWSGSGSEEDDDDDNVNDDRRYVVLAVRNDSSGATTPQAPQHSSSSSSSSHSSSRLALAPSINPTEGPVNDFACPPPPEPLCSEAVAAEAQLWRDPDSAQSEPHLGSNHSHGPSISSSRVVPARVLRGVKGDTVEAKRRCAATALWRQAYGVDHMFTGVPLDPAFDLGGDGSNGTSDRSSSSSNGSSTNNGGSCDGALALGEPQPYFAAIKRYYPHAVHGMTPQGHLVYIEKLGEAAMNLAVLQGRVGVTIAQLLRHKVTHEEYMWRVVAANNPQAQAVTVFDLAGLTMVSIGSLSKQDACKAVVDVCKEHYMERSSRIFVVNAPFWFTAPWRAISPMLSEATRSKVVICGVGAFGPLFAPGSPLQPQDVPPQYGGTSPFGFGESPEEQRLRSLVLDANAKYASSSSSNFMTVPTTDARGARSFSAATIGAACTPQGSLLPQIQASSSTNNGQDAATPAGATSSISSWTRSLPLSIAPLASNVLSAVSAAISAAPSGGGAGGRKGKRASMLWGSGGSSGLGRSGGAVGAHLGKENRFTYDETQGRWVLESSSGNTTDNDDDDDEYVVNGGQRTRRNTADRVMEERLIRAIQAAHGYNGDSPATPPPPPLSSSATTLPHNSQPSPPPSPSPSLRLRAGSMSGGSTTGWCTPLASDDGFVSADDGGYFSSDLLSDDDEQSNEAARGSTTLLPLTSSSISLNYSLPTAAEASAVSFSDPILQPSSSNAPHPATSDLEMGFGGSSNGKEALTDVSLELASPPSPLPLPAAAATSSSSSSSSPQAAPVPTGVLVIHVLWRCLHHAALHLAAAVLVASALSQLVSPPSQLLLDRDPSSGDTGAGNPASTTTTMPLPPAEMSPRAAAAACFDGGLLLLALFVVAEWGMPQCVAKLQANGLAASLRVATGLQVPALLVLAAVLPSFDFTGTPAPAAAAANVTRSELSTTSAWLLAAAFAALLGAHLAANGHKRAWVPSLPDCRRAQCLPTWLLTTAELMGALAGPAVLAFAGSDWSPGSWLRSFAALGLLFCGASSCFGG